MPPFSRTACAGLLLLAACTLITVPEGIATPCQSGSDCLGTEVCCPDEMCRERCASPGSDAGGSIGGGEEGQGGGAGGPASGGGAGGGDPFDAGLADAGPLDAGGAPFDAGLPDAGPFDAGAPLPAALSQVTLQSEAAVNSAAVGTSGVVVVGTRSLDAGQTPGDRDAMVARVGATAQAQFVGGLQNDQLYAVATRGDSFLAVGLTRSFRSKLNEDQALLVSGSVQGGALAGGRVYQPADVALQLRAVGPAANNAWVAGGPSGQVAAALVVRLSSTLAVTAARSFAFGPTTTGYTLRSVVAYGSSVAVVGNFTEGLLTVGFLATFDGPALTPGFALKLTSTANTQLADVVSEGSELIAVGSEAGDGVVLRVAASGAVTSVQRATGMPLRAIVAGTPLHVAGFAQGNVAVARVDATRLSGNHFPRLDWPSAFTRLPLLERGGGLRLVAQRGDAIVDMPLNVDLFGSCGGTRLGVPVSAPLSPAPSAAPLGFMPAAPTVSGGPAAIASATVAVQTSAACP